MSQKLLRRLIVNVMNTVEKNLYLIKGETKDSYLLFLKKIQNQETLTKTLNI